MSTNLSINDKKGLTLAHPLVCNTLASSMSGFLSRLITHPLDTVKARFQSHSRYNSIPDVIKQTMKSSEGLIGLYRGVGITLFLGTPGTMLYLTSYDHIKLKMQKKMSAINFSLPFWSIHLWAGFLAEAIACIIYVPVDVIKERLQVQYKDTSSHKMSFRSQTNYPFTEKRTLDVFKTIVQREGIKGLYRGYGATLLSYGPFSAIYFICYEWAKNNYMLMISKSNFTHNNSNKQIDHKENSKSWSCVFFSSVVSCAFSSWITSPLDMAKLHVQVLPYWNQQKKTYNKNFFRLSGIKDMVLCLKLIYEKFGIKGLYRGSGGRVLHIVPLTTINIFCYELFKSYLIPTN